jgi:hypothetical protein
MLAAGSVLGIDTPGGTSTETEHGPNFFRI